MVTSRAKAITKELLPPIVLKALRSVRSRETHTQAILEGRERGSEYYDEAFTKKEGFRKHYTESNYYPLWSVLIDRIMRAKVESLLDVGCGPGQLASFLRDKGLPRYLGFDFSTVAIMSARTICPEFNFVVADAFKTDLLHSHDYDAVVSTEFLEHVECDLEVIGKIRSGTHFFGTVPNFPCISHVRHFTSRQEVYDRYNSHFQAFSVDEFLGKAKGITFYLMEGIKV